MMKYLTTLAIICLLAVSGCGRSGEPLVTTSGSVRIENTAAECYASHGSIFLVVWHDFGAIAPSGGTSSYSGVSSSSRLTEIDGEFATSDGERVVWSCRTVDGKTGTVTISGVAYELVEGNIFLVVTDETGTRVTQLARELVKGEDFLVTMEALAESDPKIKAFVR
jgi:hypothetical protein